MFLIQYTLYFSKNIFIMKSIICGYDFSDASKNALHHACRLADFFNAKLTVVYIYNIPVPVTEFGYIDVGDEVIRNTAVKDLTVIKEQILKEHELLAGVDIVVETGLVNYKLNKLSKDKACDLLIMGIDNEQNFVKEHLLGSSSIDEARDFRIPVLIVPKSSESKKINSIAYACDYNYNFVDSTSLIQVKYFVNVFNAKLKIVHVLEPNHELNLAEAEKDKFIEQKLEHTEHQTFFVYEKSASEGITNFVHEHDVDMIIVEPQHRNFFNRLFHKSTTKELAFHLNKPILAIHGD